MALNPIVTTSPTPSSKASGVGSLSALDRSDYDLSTTRYPASGLGEDDAPHYVLFNINLPTNSKYTQNAGGVVANVNSASQNNYDLKNSQGGIYQATPDQVGTTALGTGTVGALSGLQAGGAEGAVSGGVGGAVSGAVISTAAGSIELRPKLQRVKKAIAIYMPETIVSESQHDWNAASLTQALGKAGIGAAIGGTIIGGYDAVKKAIGDAIETQSIAGFSKVLPTTFNNAQGAETVGAIAEAAGAGSDFTELALRGQNAAINPQVEMTFRGTANRHYQFVFDFQPRSAKESTTILDIIKTFRMYAAPEINTEINSRPGAKGRYFIPPAQFDISFYFKNSENLNIAKISTCALTNIQVNYNQSGQFASFSDGMPVHINLTLQFTEMDVITRELIENFGY